MTDTRGQSDGEGPPVYDDDRLLAFVLGLEDEPGLPAAAAADPELDTRLAALRADVAAVGALVQSAVPAPDESYTDLSGGRWSGLHGFFEAPARTGPRRVRRWWRALAPVAAVLALAVAIGIVAVNREAPFSPGSAAEMAQPADGAEAADDRGSGAAATNAREIAPERLVGQLDQFAVVVLARARRATDASQGFLVVRVFKGDAPSVVELDVGTTPVQVGRLHLLMLDPVVAAEGALSARTPTEPAVEDDRRYGRQLAGSYTYHGAPAVVREFDAGVDPDAVDIPVP